MAYQSSIRTITVKFAGKCACCAADIKAGEMADYDPRSKRLAHYKGFNGDSARCYGVLKSQRDAGFVDLDRAYEDQCADICGR